MNRQAGSLIHVWRHDLGLAAVLVASSLGVVTSRSAVPAADAPATSAITRPHGIAQRVPWTSSRILGTPEPPPPYLLERVFPKIEFNKPVDICAAPSSDRFFVMEERGKIYSFPNRRDAETPDLFFDLRKSIPGVQSAYGIIFHPGFETNRYVFLCYVLKENLKDGSRVSRFSVTPSDPPRIDPASETILITWLSGGHNGGCLKFGPDGCLYISTGDGAGPNPPDSLKTGQDNSDLLSCVLRIDVDHRDEGKHYRVPPDNPFVRAAGQRPEIWAYGFRNPWRMSFDRKSGELWVGDVGWELWELVYRVERGGNYGWSIVEGPQSIHPDWKRGSTPILPPIKAHSHMEAASITGGCVYRGARFKDLVGAYVYGDWVTGKIWALRSESGKTPAVQELVDTPVQIVAFGEDQAGELYVMDYAGVIHQLVPNPTAGAATHFPRQLSETGLFRSVKDQVPAPGVLPFFINAEMWSDHALAERFVALPDHSRIHTGATNVWLYQSKNEWRYPTNAVLAKTLSLPMEHGQPQSQRRVETQILHYDGLDWHAYSYRWNDEQNDATLVEAQGEEQVFEIKAPLAPDGRRKQTWRFQSRAECLRCHNPWVNYALAFTAPQLNRETQYQSNHPVRLDRPPPANASPNATDAIVPGHQLRAFSHLGFFDQPLDERARPKFTDPHANTAGADLNERARSWLHVNCAHCHREGAGGSIVSHFDYDTKLARMKAVGQLPSQGAFGLAGAHVITAGDPYSSVLYYRLLTTGPGHMPLIGPRFVDVIGANMIHDWIEQLPQELSEDKSDDPAAAKLREENAEILERITNAALGPQQETEAMDRLLSSPSGALNLLTTINKRGGANSGQAPSLSRLLEEKVATHPDFQVRDLFERFLPESRRPKKLGLSFDVPALLSLQGSAARGAKIFFQESGGQCSQCHRLNGQGRDFGPDLSQIGKKYDRAQLLDHLLHPSKVIDPAYVSYSVETQDDQSLSGLLLKRTETEVVLKDANAQEIRLPADRVKSIRSEQLSAMPEGLLQNLTASMAADLLEYLSSLR